MSAVEVQPKYTGQEFSFDAEREEQFQRLLGRYPTTEALLLPCLWLAQRQEGWVRAEAMDYIAERIEVPVTQVYEVATFYTMYKLEPVGRYHIQLCRTLSCELRGSETILAYLEKKLGITADEMTPDGRFSIELVECLGSCGSGPMMQLNEDYHEWLTEEKIDQILDKLA